MRVPIPILQEIFHKQNHCMLLQGSLRVEYNNEYFFLIVKTFLKNGAYYFFISDKEKAKPLLHGNTLELTYTDCFNAPNDAETALQVLAPGIITAVENMLLENRQLWYY